MSGRVEPRVVPVDKGGSRAKPPQRPLMNRLERLRGVEPLAPANGPAQPGSLVEGGAEVMDRNPGRCGSLRQCGVRLEGLRDERLAQINPRTQPV